MVISKISSRWRQEGGYSEVLTTAVPLILTTSFHTIQYFVDRMFLTWYSADALAAALPAGMTYFTLISLFLGTVNYVNTFVAQYFGAGRNERVGPSIWQSLYLSFIAGGLIAAASWAGPLLFAFAGHAENVRQLEVTYFRILCWGGGLLLVSNAASCFYTGQARTWVILWVNTLGTLVNLVLDYAWIFGHWGFPRWGIEGAAWATVVSQGVTAVVFMMLLLSKRNRETFATVRGWRLEKDLLLRLIRFGFPAGLQFFIEMTGFTAVVLLVGRLGNTELAATNVAFNINMLAFLPMIGFAIATSTLVGQRLGQNRPDLAARSTWSTYHLTSAYMIVLAFSYVLVPELYLWPFRRHADPVEFAAIQSVAIVLLRFVALYSLFDAMNIVFASALKGAGDTRFVLWISVSLCWTIMVVPAWLACEVWGWGVYAIWWFMTIYIILLGVAYLLRFLQGKWRSMRVIERGPAPLLVAFPEVPAPEIES